MFNYLKIQREKQEKIEEGKPSKKKTTGAFGGRKRFLGDYKTLKVIPRSKRTKENCNASGVAI